MNPFYVIVCFAAVAMLGAWIIAAVLRIREADSIASYPLFAVRDALVAKVVFEGVPRDDVWVETLYRLLNDLLTYSHVVSGPGLGWSIAQEAGKRAARMRLDANSWPGPLPVHEPMPTALGPVLESLRDALQVLVKQHIGVNLQTNANRREALRLKREAARELCRQLGGPRPCAM